MTSASIPLGVRIAAIPDTHFPFEDRLTIQGIYNLLEAYRPHIVLQLGDLNDMISFGRFDRSMNTYTPRRELKLARERGERFWWRIHKIVPRAKLIQLTGNHDIRPLRRILSQAPELEDFVSIASLLSFDHVETVSATHEEVVDIYGIYFLHGFLTRPGAHSRRFMRHTVHGHTHRGGTVLCHNSRDSRRRTLWSLDCGYAGDPLAVSFAFAGRFPHWTHGMGLIDYWGPRFVELPHRRDRACRITLTD